MILHIPTIVKNDFSAFKNICGNEVVGQNYGDFIKLTGEMVNDAKKLDLEAIKIRIDPEGFSTWLHGKKAAKKDLLQYAAAISRKPLVPDSDGLLTRSLPKNVVPAHPLFAGPCGG